MSVQQCEVFTVLGYTLLMNKTALSNAPWVVPGGHRHKTKPNFQLFIYMCGVATKIKEEIESKEDFSDSSKLCKSISLC